MSIIYNSNLFKELNVLEEEFKQYVKLDVDNKYYDDNDYTTPYDIHQIILLSDYIDNDTVFDKYMGLLKTKILKLDEEFIDYFKTKDDIKGIIKTTYDERLYNAINSILNTGDIENMDDVYYSVDLMKKHNITDINFLKLSQICDIECLEYVKNIQDYEHDKYYDIISYRAVECDRWDIILYLKTKIKLDVEELCYCAAENGKLDILKKLYNDVVVFDKKYDCDVMYGIVESNQIECFKFLFDNGHYFGSECCCDIIYLKNLELLNYLVEKNYTFDFNEMYLYISELLKDKNDICNDSKYKDKIIKNISEMAKLLKEINNENT